jgi:ribokinase
MGDVTIIGSYIVAQVIDAVRIPVEGETVTGRNYHITHGGKGSNMACSASRLGARSRFIGKVGRDAFGQGFLDLLQREGVGTEGVVYSERLPTAMGFIICAPSGTNIIVIDMGANGQFTPNDVQSKREIIETSAVVLSPLEIPLETALEAASIAKASNIPAILNPAPACDLRGIDLNAVFALTPNETEARVCLGLPPEHLAGAEDLARALVNLGPQNVILTLGSQGALWATRKYLRRTPALEVEVVDTVGAGDAFNAGLAAGLSEHMSVEDAISLGVTAASLSTRKRETIESYPYRDEVDIWLHEMRAKAATC